MLKWSQKLFFYKICVPNSVRSAAHLYNPLKQADKKLTKFSEYLYCLLGQRRERGWEREKERLQTSSKAQKLPAKIKDKLNPFACTEWSEIELMDVKCIKLDFHYRWGKTNKQKMNKKLFFKPITSGLLALWIFITRYFQECFDPWPGFSWGRVDFFFLVSGMMLCFNFRKKMT